MKRRQNSWWTPAQGLGSAVLVVMPQPADIPGINDVRRSTSLRMDPSPGDRYNAAQQDDFSVPVKMQVLRAYQQDASSGDLRRVGLTSMGADTPLPSLNRWNQIKLGSVFHRQAPQRWSSAAKNPGFPGFVDNTTGASMASPHDVASAVFFNPTANVTGDSFRRTPGIGSDRGQTRSVGSARIGGS
jgi:hypothetical protein